MAEEGREEMGKRQGKGRVNSSPTRELASLKLTLGPGSGTWGLSALPEPPSPCQPHAGMQVQALSSQDFSPRWEAVRKLASYSIPEKHILESAPGQEALDTTLE